MACALLTSNKLDLQPSHHAAWKPRHPCSALTCSLFSREMLVGSWVMP